MDKSIVSPFFWLTVYIPKLTAIGQLLLKLLLVVGWYTFLQHSLDVIMQSISTGNHENTIY